MSLRTKPAYQQVAAQLREWVLSGDLAPGERLPNESQLSEVFGVSRSTVREALRWLSSQGLITTLRGVTGGSFVAHPQPGEVSEYLEASVGLLSGAQVVSVAELLEARALLEVPAARLAAERHDAEHLRALHDAVEEEDRALDAGFEGHRGVHTAVLDAAGNGLLAIMTTPLFAVLRTRFLRDLAPPAFWKEVCDDHRLLVERIADRDADGAAAAMHAHLDHLRDTYEQIDRLHPAGEGTVT